MTEKKYVQQVVGSFQYYARSVDLTIQQALNAIAEEHSNPTEKFRDSKPMFGLHGNTSWHGNSFLRFRHDFERTFWRFLPNGKQHAI